MSPKYEKLARGEQPGPLRPFTGRTAVRLRITLGDMSLDEAFEAWAEDVDAGESVGGLLERLFGGHGEWRPSNEDLARNPTCRNWSKSWRASSEAHSLAEASSRSP